MQVHAGAVGVRALPRGLSVLHFDVENEVFDVFDFSALAVGQIDQPLVDDCRAVHHFGVRRKLVHNLLRLAAQRVLYPLQVFLAIRGQEVRNDSQRTRLLLARRHSY